MTAKVKAGIRKTGDKPVDMAKALTHPLRRKILETLVDETSSPSKLAVKFGAPLGDVSYHVRQLRALGLIRMRRQVPVRGSFESFYGLTAKGRACATPLWICPWCFMADHEPGRCKHGSAKAYGMDPSFGPMQRIGPYVLVPAHKT